jgi:hypothetical protein
VGFPEYIADLLSACRRGTISQQALLVGVFVAQKSQEAIQFDLARREISKGLKLGSGRIGNYIQELMDHGFLTKVSRETYSLPATYRDVSLTLTTFQKRSVSTAPPPQTPEPFQEIEFGQTAPLVGQTALPQPEERIQVIDDAARKREGEDPGDYELIFDD